MAKLPTRADLGPRPIPQSRAGIAQISDSAMQAPGRAVQRMGRTVKAVGDEIEDRIATTQAKEADAAAAERIRDLLYNPETGFLNSEGKNTVAGYESIKSRIQAIRDEVAKDLSPIARRKVDGALSSRIDGAFDKIYAHTASQRKVWINSASDARMRQAALDAFVDPSATERALNDIQQELLGQSAREGWSQEEYNLKFEEKRSDLFANQTKALAQKSPSQALEYLEANADKMQIDDLLSLRQSLEPLAAEERGRDFGRRLARGMLTGNIALYADAIASIESKGSGDYSAVGPVVKGDRAYGKYQVMGANIPSWTRRWLGREMTPQEFLKDPAAQDAVFAGQFGMYVEKYGNPVTAARAWFGFGESDGYTSGKEYERRFASYVRTHKAPPSQSLGMIGGVKSDGTVWQSMDGQGQAHGPEYRDYSQLFREYRFERPNPNWIEVGQRNGKTVYAAPDYARDASGRYISVSAADVQRMAKERGSLIPTRDEVKALYGKASQVAMPTSEDFGKDGGEGTSEEYTAHVRARMSMNGLIEGVDPVVHGKEFFSTAGTQQTDMERILSIQDENEREAALREYTLWKDVEESQKTAALKAAGDEAFKLIEAGGAMDDLPVDIRQALGREQMTSLRAYERSKATGVPIETDPEVYLRLRTMAAQNPDGFMKEDLIQYVDKLSEADWQEMVKLQTAPPSDASSIAVSTLMTQAKRGLEASGIDTTPEPGSDDAKRVAAFQTRLVRWQENFRLQNNRAPTQAEIDEQISSELLPIVMDPPGLGNKFTGPMFELGDIEVLPDDLTDTSFTIDGVAVPAAVIEEQIQAMDNAGEPVTPEALAVRIRNLMTGGT